MKTCKFILYAVAGVLLVGCLRNQKTLSLATETATYLESYKAPVFPSTDRLQKIKDVLPAIEEIFKAHAEKNNYPGFAYGLVVDDSLIFSGGIGVINLDNQQPVTSQSLFRIASLTKSFTAMAVVKLRDEGKLSLVDPASKYVPELADLTYLTKDSPPISIQDLLTMTAGFPEDNPWADRQLEDTNEELIQLLHEGLSFSTVPSTNYEYSNLGFAILGNIISRVSGMPYQQYITEHLLNPLGMTDTYWEYSNAPADQLVQGYRWEDEQWKTEPMLHDGAFGAIGGLITSIEDFSKYVAFHLSAWPPNNKPETGPVKHSSVREMHKLHEPRLDADAKDANDNPCPTVSGYGYGLAIQKNCKGTVRINHSGGLPGFGSEYRFYPNYGIGIISFSNRTYASTGSANAKAMNILMAWGIKSRELSVSDILSHRKEQVIQLIETWDKKLGNEILAENFYLDRSRKHRMEDAKRILRMAGEITFIAPLVLQNQLRGTFVMHGEKENIEVFFSLSPESIPKVQRLNMRIVEETSD